MLLARRFLVVLLVISFAVPAVFAQEQERERTPEETYLQQSIENMIIRETARSSSREQKMIALEYITEAIDGGNTSPDVHSALEYLATESTRSQTRESGRLMNNYPEIRREAAKLLGTLGTEEAAQILVSVARVENEPMVLQEIVKSLGDIGFNDEDNVVIRTIAFYVSQFNDRQPSDILAIATIDAFEKLAAANDGLNSREAIELLNNISANYRYTTPVRERARQSLAGLRSASAGGGNRNNSGNNDAAEQQ